MGKVIRETPEGDHEYYQFTQREFFNRLGAADSYCQGDGADAPIVVGPKQAVVVNLWSCSEFYDASPMVTASPIRIVPPKTIEAVIPPWPRIAL